MPTVITKTVKAGGDYSSLASAIAGTAANLVSNDQQLNIACYASATADQTYNAQLNVGGYTTDATHYVKIYTPPTERHPGWWNGTFYWLGSTVNTGVGTILSLVSQYTVVDGIAVRSTASQNSGVVRNTQANMTWQNCLIDGGNACSTGISCALGSPSTTIINCVVINCTGWSIQGRTGNTWVYNSTVISPNGLGMENGIFKNCLVKGAQSGNAFTNIDSGSDYNATDVSSATGGAHDRVSQTFMFVDSANGNYQLASTDTGAKGYGTDLSGTFTTDIHGNVRTTPWDIGAFKAPPTVVTDNFNRTNGTSLVSTGNWIGASDAQNSTEFVSYGNGLSAVYPGTGEMIRWSHPIGNDQYSQFVCQSPSFHYGVAVRVIPNGSGINLNGYGLYTTNSGLALSRYDDGNETSLNFDSGTYFSAGDVLRLEITGSTLTAKMNGAVLWNVTDSTYPSGQPGIIAGYNASGYTIADNWEGGDITGPSPDASVTLTGASATTAAGTVTKSASSSVTLTGAACTLAAGIVLAAVVVNGSVTLTGAASTCSAGTVTTSGNAAKTLTGASSTTAAGGTSETGTGAKTITGAGVNSAAGTLTLNANGTSTLTGAALTTAAGGTSETGTASYTLTGASATASPGTVTAAGIGSVFVNLTGASVTSTAGTVTTSGQASKTITGASSTTSPGSVVAGTSASITLTGASVTSSPGSTTESGLAAKTLTGAASTSTAGTVVPSANATLTLTGASSATSAGTVQAGVSASVTLVGAKVTSAPGTLSETTTANLTLTGARSTTAAGTVTTLVPSAVTLTGASVAATAGYVTVQTTSSSTFSTSLVISINDTATTTGSVPSIGSCTTTLLASLGSATTSLVDTL